MTANDKEILEGFEDEDEFLVEKTTSPNGQRNVSQPYACLNNKKADDVESSGEDQEMNKSSKSKSTGKRRADVSSARTEKNKVIWTRDLHMKFLEAIKKIGIERAVPKKILELMEEEGLTRDNIASHLQKYRIFLKKIEEANYGIQIASQPILLESSMTNGGPWKNSSSMLDQTMPQQKSWSSYKGMHVINPPILDTSYSVLEASSFNATNASELTHLCSLPNQVYSMQALTMLTQTIPNSLDDQRNLIDDASKSGNVSSGYVNPVNFSNSGFMQNLDGFMYDYGASATDVYPYTSTEMGSSSGLYLTNELPMRWNHENQPITRNSSSSSFLQSSNGIESNYSSQSEFVEMGLLYGSTSNSNLENGIGEDDLILDAGIIASLCETFIPEEPCVDYEGVYGSTSQVQPVALVPLNQDVNEQYFQNMVPVDSNYNEDHVNYQQRSIEDATNNYMHQTSDGCLPGLDPTFNMQYDEQLMGSMWRPELVEEDTTLQGLF